MITIIIPVYNAEKHLHSCIDSVQAQTFKEWQLILINDGSTDSSLHICRSYVEKDERISVFSQLNNGQAAARNFGIHKTSTPYIAFMDADDTLSYNVLSENMKILCDNPSIDCVQYPAYMYFESINQYLRNQNAELITVSFYEHWLAQKKISWTVWDKIFTTDLVRKVAFKEGIIFEDNLFIAQILGHIRNIYLSEEGVYYYYCRTNSTMTSSISLKKEKDSFYVTYEIFKILINKKLQVLALDFLVRSLNIRKSLEINFNEKVLLQKEHLDYFSYLDILKSKLSLKSKIKIFQSKIYAN